MKKIVFTVTNDLTYDQRMNRICSTLQNNGYDVTLIGFFKKRSINIGQKPFKQYRLFVFFKKGKLFYLEYNIKLFWYLLVRKYDLYCGIDLDTLLPVYLNAKMKRKPCIYDAHEYFTELPEVVDRPMIKKMWDRLERRILPHIQWNYTVSNSIANALQNKYHQQYAVIRNVPYLTPIFHDEKKDGYIIYQGALNTGRGLEQLMRAMADIPLQLFIAGEGDLSAALRQFASTLPHASRIRFLGYIRPEELRNYTAKAVAGVNLVENKGLSYYYSLSNKFFDYIQAGLPQITMNFPEYAALNEQYHVAILIDDLQVAGITNAIRRLLDEPGLSDSLQANALMAREKLNWQEEEKKLLEFYSSIE